MNSAPGRPVLRLEGVSFAYGSSVAVSDVSFSARPGEILALLGPNGAGKSTVLKLAAGLLRPAGGVLNVAGERARSVAYLAQSDPLPPDFTAGEVAALGRLPFTGLLGREGPADRAAVRAALEATGALGFANRAIGTLSGGERQRVALARALAQEPRLLLLDEPANHLDIAHQAGLMSVLREQARSGLTVIMVVHDLNLAAQASRGLLLDAGRLVQDAPIGELLASRQLETTYGLSFERLRTSDGRIVLVPAVAL